jgi:hypothetical protein
VQINGAPRGKTPLTLSLAEGSYQVRLTLDGHQPYTATLRPQRSHHLDAQLSPAPAKEAPPTEPDPASLVEVSFYVTRDGAPGSSPCVLSVDGKEHRPGVGRYTLKLSAGPHRVTARGLDELSSYSASQSFQIAPTDKDKRIILTMRRADP